MAKKKSSESPDLDSHLETAGLQAKVLVFLKLSLPLAGGTFAYLLVCLKVVVNELTGKLGFKLFDAELPDDAKTFAELWATLSLTFPFIITLFLSYIVLRFAKIPAYAKLLSIAFLISLTTTVGGWAGQKYDECSAPQIHVSYLQGFEPPYKKPEPEYCSTVHALNIHRGSVFEKAVKRAARTIVIIYHRYGGIDFWVSIGFVLCLVWHVHLRVPKIRAA